MQDLIALSKASAKRAEEWLIRAFSHVPDEKLHWSPTPESRSALQIVAHAAVTNSSHAAMIRQRRVPQGDEIPVHVARTAEAERQITTREEALRLLAASTQEVLAALDTVRPEEADLELDSSMGWTVPLSFFVQLPGIHAMLHVGQLDYLQTCWGDMEIYVK